MITSKKSITVTASSEQDHNWGNAVVSTKSKITINISKKKANTKRIRDEDHGN
jgi:uncharacterized protein YhjY with autotransporter beta-barrel domain